ncbi:hypothetical protein Rt10032_c10g4327 [Rhodotorula toruloides]|uniref:Uncharacterized protein n=1 Tax=Rhodotorula toruloides TaxID=5286 RepID=A0A511KIX7_RHOTO|nr:hypothetical protein Rt10032_c10g4327 [Rhodotorula toruloides]
MQLKLLSDNSVISIDPLPVHRILPERSIPLDTGNYIGLPPERNSTWDFAIILPDQKLFILAQITLFKDFKKFFVFVTPDEGSAKSFALKWDRKKKKRSSSGRRLAPAALSKYSIGYATFSHDELIELAEESPALRQGAFA